MEVEAFLADSVEAVQGKLYVMGAGWNIINVLQLPATHARVGIGIIIGVPYTATNQSHSFEVRLVDEDEHSLPLGDAPSNVSTEDGKIRKFGGTFNVGRPPTIQAGDEQLVTLAMNIDGLQFERESGYAFVISVDQTDVKRLHFRIIHQKNPMPVIG